MKNNFLLLSFLLFSVFGFSQNITISGNVIDAKAKFPLPSVNIVDKTTGKNLSTDIDGNFKISDLSNTSVLEFSFIGYKNYILKVTQSQVVTISLQEDTNSLEEVVVIGYGQKQRKLLTGSVTTISSKTIDQIQPIKVEQALQGTVSGVTVTGSGGAPGAGLNIRIRGVSTNGNNGPLVIIDGYQGSLDLLNPNDVETITVLKDAQAAIYGTIGSNGVVLITTKTGKKNSKTQVSYNSYTGFQQTTKKLNLLNATEYALLLNESYANGGQALPFPDVSNLGKGTDWQNEVFNDAPIYSQDFSVTGGSDKITYGFSGSDLYQQGIIGGGKSDFKRNTARLNLGVELSPKIKINSNFIYTYVDRDAINDNGLGSVLFNAINTPSTISAFDANGDYSLVPSTPGFGIEVINPLAQIENTYNDFKLKKLSGSFDVEYDIFKGFKLTSRIGFNTSNSNSKSFAKQISYGGKVFDVARSSVSQNKINDNDYTFDLFGAYTKTIADNHNFKLTAGTTIYKSFGSGLFATGYDVPNNVWENADLSLAQGVSEGGGRDVGGYEYDFRRTRHFARLEYDFKGKYLFSGMISRDVSLRFGPDERVAYFPSFTSGWILSEESFFDKTKFLNFFKIRASYGLLGNDQIRDYGYRGLLNGEATYVFDDTLTNGTATGALANPSIKWEADEKVNVGFDLKMWNNKVTITTDLYQNTRKDLLINNIPVSGIFGTSAPGSGAPTINAGSVRNRGIEFAIDYADKINDNLRFSLGYNIATLDNEVIEVNNSTGFLEGGSFGVGQLVPSRFEAGHAAGYFYGLVSDGIFQNQQEITDHPSQSALGAATAPGDIRYKDINQDGVIDFKDRTDIGDPIAKVTMGFNINVFYKNFDFIAYSYASLGNDMVRNYERNLSNLNKLNYTLGRWTGEGTSNSVPRVTTAATNNSVLSDYFVEDASFLRIQTLQLGYTIDKKFSQKIGINKFRVYTTVNNLYTFTKYRGFDPTANDGNPIGGGIDNGFYPQPKTFLLGVNLNF
jgi:TonB-linked SusC/RagA family outer membrane protein